MVQVVAKNIERCLIIFLSLSINNQIWLNQLMYNCQLDYITKLGKISLFNTYTSYTTHKYFILLLLSLGYASVH
jgi:hypothetical protein